MASSVSPGPLARRETQSRSKPAILVATAGRGFDADGRDGVAVGEDDADSVEGGRKRRTPHSMTTMSFWVSNSSTNFGMLALGL